MSTDLPAPRSLLRRRGHVAAVLLLTRPTIREVAREMGLHPNTILFWSRVPWFQALLDETRRVLRDELVRQAVVTGAVETALAGRLVPDGTAPAVETGGEWVSTWKRRKALKRGPRAADGAFAGQDAPAGL